MAYTGKHRARKGPWRSPGPSGASGENRAMRRHGGVALAATSGASDRRARCPSGHPETAVASSARVLAVIPAHNEAAQIGDTIVSLLSQTRPPERIVVVADNCTDETAQIAAGMGVEVFETVGNVHKKAGALNQALDMLLPSQAEDDVVLIMDADSVLVPTWLQSALEWLPITGGAVSGAYIARSLPGLLPAMQHV